MSFQLVLRLKSNLAQVAWGNDSCVTFSLSLKKQLMSAVDALLDIN